MDPNYGSYKNPDDGIVYEPDGQYVDGGENHMVAPEHQSGTFRPYSTVRSFPSGVRNCYALPTVAGAKYLVRVRSAYGNYDGKNSSSTIQFDLYLGVNYWATVKDPWNEFHEALFVAWASWVPVCLLNTGRGTPFASSVVLRRLSSELYPVINAKQSMRMISRKNVGSDISTLRYIIVCIFKSIHMSHLF